MFALSTTYFYGYVPDDNYYDYVIALRNQALYNYVFSDYGTATIQGMFVLNMTKKIVGKESSDYAIALRNMSLFNYSKGNYVEAMKEGTEALSLFEKLFGKEHPDYAIALRNMALYSYSLGNYTEAINQGTEALSIFEELFGKECSDYAIALSNLALYNFAVKNYSEAIRQGNKAINILGRIFGKAHFSYAMALNRLAGCYSSCGNHTEAINLGTEAANIFERTLKKIYNETAITLSIYNTFHDNFLENLMLTVYNMASYDKYKNNINLNYAKILSDLAGYYFLQENYIEAIRLETEAMNIRGKFYYFYEDTYVMARNTVIDGYQIDSEGVSVAKGIRDKIEEIKKYEGYPYVTGGDTPDGWDCSGCIQWIYQNIFGISLPRTTYEQVLQGSAVSIYDMSLWQLGDLIFFSSGSISHVGLYLGDNLMLHALGTRYGTRIDDVQWYDNWDSGVWLAAVRRVL